MPNYPGPIDLERYLVAAGLFEYPLTQAQQAMDLDGFLRSAVSEFELATNRIPFLSSGQVETATIQYTRTNPVAFPYGRYLLSLDAGADALSVNGVNYAVGSQAFLLPENAPSERKPYSHIRFGLGQDALAYGGWYGTGFYFDLAWGAFPVNIAIRGIWGYSLTLPEDARQAILAKAALLAAPQLGLQISGGLYSVRDLNSEIRYGGGQLSTLSDQVKLWTGQFEKTVRQYQGYAL